MMVLKGTMVLGPRALMHAAQPLHQLAASRGLSRRQLLHLVRTLASAAPPVGQQGSTGTYRSDTDGYSAGDDPDSRKNPLLYQSLTELRPPTASPAASATQTLSSHSQEPSVTTLINTATHTGGSSSGPTAARALVKPEVLSPVGGWPQLRAAVENGADSVYFGLTDFNARARANNFTLEELPEVMTYLRDRGVKGFVTFNVLVFDEELRSVEEYIRAIASAGVDAVIVQDLAVVELVRRIAPGLPVHGSTQMSITSAEGAEFAGGLGVERVVVGRELSVKEIAKVRNNATPEVEAFVHGALCVSYSGQCFSSEAWGGRSANRGQCAQACRMPYGLLVNGQLKELADAKYLLSPQDLAAVEQVPELILAGVSCFKIEGRLKGPEYVALTTQVYRRAVDAAWAALTGATTNSSANSQLPQLTNSRALAASESFQAAKQAVSLTDQQKWDLEQVFARGQDSDHRGLTPGFLEGVVHQRLVRGRAPRHRGVFAGRVVKVLNPGSGGDRRGQQTQLSQQQNRQRSGGRGGRGGPGARDSGPPSSSPGVGATVLIELEAPLKKGDGLVFDKGQPEEKEEGGSVYDLLDARGRPVRQGMISPGGVDTTRDSTSASQPLPSRGGRGQRGGQGQSDRAQGSVGDMEMDGQQRTLVAVVFGPGQVDASRLQEGDLVWRTRDSTLDSRLASTWASLPEAERRRAGVMVAVRGRVGEPLTVVMRDEQGREAVGMSNAPLAAAQNRALTVEDLTKAVGAVGGDGFRLSAPLDTGGLALDQGLFMPVGELKAARRAAAEALTGLRRQHARDLHMAVEPVLPDLLRQIASRAPATTQQAADNHPAPQQQETTEEVGSVGSEQQGAMQGPMPGKLGSKAQRAWVVAAGQASTLRVLCRSAAQVEAALQVPWLSDIVLDFLEVQGLKEAVAAVRASGRRVTVATPRILKPDEERLVHFYLRLRADSLLVRSAGLLHQLVNMGGPGSRSHGLTDPSGQPLQIPDLEGDFSLNAANAITADLLLSRGRLSRLSPTHDLSASQICTLARSLGKRGSQLEVILHHHLPIFHTEHCVFARFLSSGNSYKDCGHPCEHNQVHLRDDKGADHLLLADMGCRNTLFNAAAQSGAFYLTDLLKAGVRNYRVELVDQPPEVVEPLLNQYRELLDGKTTPGSVWGWLKTLPDANGRSHGVTPGSLGGLAGGQERDRDTMKPTAAALKHGMMKSMGAGIH